MPEPGEVLPPSEPAREKPIFPVTREAVDRSLGEIAQDPNAAMTNELSRLTADNRVVSAGLNEYIDSVQRVPQMGMGEQDLMEGMCLAHRILRTQAEMSGRTLPAITEDQWVAHSASRFEALGKAVSRGEGMRTIVEGAMGEIAQGDPQFAEAVQEFGKYRVGRIGVMNGAIEVYRPFQSAVEAQAMEAQISPQPPGNPQ